MPSPIRLPRSFRAQLAVCFALLGGVLAISLSAALGGVLAEHGRHEAGSTLNATAHNAALLLADGLDTRTREVQALADSPTLWRNGLDSQGVAQVLARSQLVNPFHAWIGVADAEGIVRVATGRMLVGAQVKSRPWFEAGLRGTHVGDVHPAKLLAGLLPPGSDGGPQRFVDFAAPIRRDGRVIGVLGIHGSWEWTRATIESLLPERDERRSLEVFVFDRAGQMIYAPDAMLARQVAAGQTLPQRPGARPAGTIGHEAEVTRWRDGEDYLSAAAEVRTRGAIAELGWTVVARQPVSAAYAVARHGAWLALMLGLVAAAASAALGWWLSGRLTGALRAMAQDALSIDAQGQPVQIALRRGSLEVERLSHALHGMTQRLLRSNAELEQRVQQRTAELEHANAALERLAHLDPLTGLLNRRGFDERLRAVLAGARRRGAPLSLLTLDADHFKRVNDRFGHEAGDQVLCAIAATLKSRLREADLVARVGGEEFVAVLVDTGSLGAAHVAEALVAAVAMTPMPAVGSITISCGAAELQGDEPIEAALRRADAALYEAKQTGRNRYVVAAASAAAVLPRPGVERALAATA